MIYAPYNRFIIIAFDLKESHIERKTIKNSLTFLHCVFNKVLYCGDDV